MSYSRQLSELSASELNDAIDDTNFPQAHILSRGRNNSVCSVSSVLGMSTDPRTLNIALTEAEKDDVLNVNGISNKDAVFSSIVDGVTPNDHVVSASSMGKSKLTLKTKGIMPVDNWDASKTTTPITPRTSTTPGICLI